MPDPLALYTYADLATRWQLAPRTVQAWVSRDRRKGYVVPTVRRRVGPKRWVVFMTGATAEAMLRRHWPTLFP